MQRKGLLAIYNCTESCGRSDSGIDEGFLEEVVSEIREIRRGTYNSSPTLQLLGMEWGGD